MRLPRLFVRKRSIAASVEPVEPPPGVDLLALAAVTPETAEVLSDEEIRKVLSSIDQESPGGARNMAIIVTLLDTGLRVVPSPDTCASPMVVPSTVPTSQCTRLPTMISWRRAAPIGLATMK